MHKYGGYKGKLPQLITFFYCPLALFYWAILLWIVYQHCEIWRIRMFEVNGTKHINLLIGSLNSVSNSMPQVSYVPVLFPLEQVRVHGLRFPKMQLDT